MIFLNNFLKGALVSSLTTWLFSYLTIKLIGDGIIFGNDVDFYLTEFLILLTPFLRVEVLGEAFFTNSFDIWRVTPLIFVFHTLFFTIAFYIGSLNEKEDYNERKILKKILIYYGFLLVFIKFFFG